MTIDAMVESVDSYVNKEDVTIAYRNDQGFFAVIEKFNFTIGKRNLFGTFRPGDIVKINIRRMEDHEQ